MLQENKARQILRKTNISYPLIRTRRCAYQGLRKVYFSQNCIILFDIRPLLPYYRRAARVSPFVWFPLKGHTYLDKPFVGLFAGLLSKHDLLVVTGVKGLIFFHNKGEILLQTQKGQVIYKLVLFFVF